LASNLRDQIDPAFARRFHVTVHFPRPGLAERRRIWEIAFPTAAPLDPTVDLDVLSRLELTGAGITGVAHTAALLAADAGAPLIGIAQIVQAAVRQYRREARILTPSELGPYAPLLKGSA
jgi:ATP-dependent 26S proteasome regulatory subunit